MGVIDLISSFFTPKPSFGKVNPDDIEAVWQVGYEVDQAERRGARELADSLARWGFEDREQWRRARAALRARHQSNPDFAMAGARVRYRIRAQARAGACALPPSYAVEGVTLDRRAVLRARLELALPQGDEAVKRVLAEYGFDERRWWRIDAMWSHRLLEPTDEVAAATLRSTWEQYLAIARATYAKQGP